MLTTTNMDGEMMKSMVLNYDERDEMR